MRARMGRPLQPILGNSPAAKPFVLGAIILERPYAMEVDVVHSCVVARNEFILELLVGSTAGHKPARQGSKVVLCVLTNSDLHGDSQRSS